MVSSLLISIVLLVLSKNGIEFSTHISLIITVAFTTICWLLVTYIGPQTDRKTLIEFYKKIRPSGPGWNKIRVEAGVDQNNQYLKDSIPLNLLAWFLGCVTIWASLFTAGNFLYGKTTEAMVLLVISLISGYAIIRIIKKLGV